MVGLNALTKHFAVGAKATHGDTRKVNAVVAFLTPDKTGLVPMPLARQ